MSDKIATIVEQVKSLTVVELVELVAQLKQALGVSDAALAGPAVVAAPAAGAPAPAAAPAAEAPTSFKVTLVSGGANKINAIKVVREVLGLGLADAKAFVEGAPKVVKEGIDKAAADEIAKKFKDAGAEVKVEGV
ncbi:MAG: 50S ribosomal protein L7/L12 [Planctomycetota bacterium]|nr:50S ribosomal protein L7/L12 [Planctomycetota bacterium]MCX8040203.1 50S ribosomal protein L7/L12 [Planctomycetota bacterium]MDW8372502.1 50S ribosomal protein L7/L12 [Planctomycetota bacterium]